MTEPPDRSTFKKPIRSALGRNRSFARDTDSFRYEPLSFQQRGADLFQLRVPVVQAREQVVDDALCLGDGVILLRRERCERRPGQDRQIGARWVDADAPVRPLAL